MGAKAVVTEKNRAEVLGTCRHITFMLDTLQPRARELGMTLQHTSLQARSAVFVCRLTAGHSSLRLALEMNTFVQEYNAHVEVLAR